MKKTLILSILIIFFTTSFIFIVGCNNHNPKEVYELQEKCKKSSEEYFRDNYGKDGWYECHYNKKMNKCFFSYNHLSSGSELYDINEHKSYGRCSKGSCDFYILNKRSIRPDEWDKLVKPYMEE